MPSARERHHSRPPLQPRRWARIAPRLLPRQRESRWRLLDAWYIISSSITSIIYFTIFGFYEAVQAGAGAGARRGGGGSAGTTAGGTAHGPGTVGARRAAARSEGWAGGWVARVGPHSALCSHASLCLVVNMRAMNIIMCLILCPRRDSGDGLGFNTLSQSPIQPAGR